MKKLVLGSLIALTATQAAGCVIESGGDDAFITANWTFRNEATGTTTSCPPGFDTVALYNQEVTASGSNIGSPIIDLFDCAASSGTSAPLPPTLFKSWIEVTDHNNTSVYAQSTEAYVDVTVSDKSFNAQILNDGGYFLLAWNLTQGGAPASCSQAPGGIDVIGTEVSNPSNSADDQFDCEDGADYTAGYVAGNYTVSISALNSADQAIGTPVNLTNKVIGDQNQVTNLGTVTIPLD